MHVGENRREKGLLQFAAVDGFDLNRFYGRNVKKWMNKWLGEFMNFN